MQPFLSIGGDYNTFWNLTPKTIQVFFRAFEDKRKRDLEMAWLQGLYFKQALQSSVMVCGLADKNVVRNMPQYPKSPLEEEKEQNKELDLEKEKEKLIMKLDTWQKLNNRNNHK